MPEKMPELSREDRVRIFREIKLGYSEKQALREAERCLQCKKPGCVKGCPVQIDIPSFIKALKGKKLKEAMKIIQRSNPFPSWTSRCCPQEELCEANCVLREKGAAINIGALERFVADKVKLKKVKPKKDTGKKVAVIGSGPAGMAAALFLKKKGFGARVFEKERFFGGLLVEGVPGFRLENKHVKKAVKWLKKCGIKFSAHAKIGDWLMLKDLQKNYSALLIACGESTAKKIYIPGRYLRGAWYWNDFLREFSSGRKRFKKPKPCLIIGGGDTSIDCARIARRMNCNTTIVCRKSEDCCPATPREMRLAKDEGVDFAYNLSPVSFIGNKKLEAVLFQKTRMENSEAKPVPGKFEKLSAELAVIAIGQEFDESLLKGTRLYGKEFRAEGCRTFLPGVFVAGDLVNEKKTVVNAIKSAARAVEEIERYVNA